MSSKARTWRGRGAAITLPAMAARAVAIREIDESLIILNKFGGEFTIGLGFRDQLQM